jgi:hypothetical protein
MHRSWIHPEVHLSTGRLCSAGSGCRPFPDVIARMRPSDSQILVVRGCGLPSPAAYLGADASSVRSHIVASAGRARIRLRTARRRVVTGSPSLRKHSEGEPGPPRCLDRPLAACHGRTTSPGAISPRPLPGRPLWPSGTTTPSAPGIFRFSRLHSHGPLARVLTHRRSRRRGRRKAHYRPGGLTLCRAGSHPLDDEPNFLSLSHFSFLSDQPCLVALWSSVSCARRWPRRRYARESPTCAT